MLFCTNCKQPRVANEAPCPTCGAPSPLQGNSPNFQGANPTATSWDGPLAPNSWGSSNTNFADQQLPFPDPQNSWSASPTSYQREPDQLPFSNGTDNWGSPPDNQGFNNFNAPNTPEVTPFPPQGDQGQQNFPFQNPDQNDQWGQAQQWGQIETPQENTVADFNAGSMLPVPYQGDQSQNLMVMPQAPAGNGGALVPYEPRPNEGPVFVPPMYTKPRPIIARRRAISGLISFIVVTILLCSGATYAAKVTGQFSFVNTLFGSTAPASLQPTAQPKLPDPKTVPETGPAKAIIFSATTASSITDSLIPIQPSQVFKPGQTIYVTYTVHPKGSGIVTIKWFTDNQLFHSVSSPKFTEIKNGSTNLSFPKPLEGRADLYWNDQLAIRLFFVVR